MEVYQGEPTPGMGNAAGSARGLEYSSSCRQLKWVNISALACHLP